MATFKTRMTRVVIPSTSVKSKFLKTLPINTIYKDSENCHKYIIQEKQSNVSLIKAAVPYFGIEDAIDINPPAELLKQKNPKSEMKKKIAELEALNKQLLATCGPVDKMEIIQSKLGDKRYLETDQDTYLLDNGLVFNLPKKRMKGEGQDGGAVSCRDECEKFKNRIWREPNALAKLVKRQSKIQDRMLEDLLRN